MAVAKADQRDETELSSDLLRAMYRHMVRARVLDERMWVLNRQGRAPFVISCQGHEAAQVGIAMALEPGRDWMAPYYRDLAMTLVFGMTFKDHLLSVLARADDPNSGARQMPAHYGCHRLNIISTGSPVTTQLLHAAGIALGHRIRGEDAVTVTALGEGSTSGGDFHEALNFAATHKLGVLFVVENNGYAISVPWTKQMPTPDVSDRAKAYGMAGYRLDGNDPISCHHAAVEAVQRARSGGGPSLLEVKVHRLTSHSSDDNEKLYRSAEELEEIHRTDCLLVFRAKLEEMGVLQPGDAEEIRAEAVREVDRATDEADAAPLPDVSTVMHHVYGEEGR